MAFLRAVRDDAGVLAIKLINESLDAGEWTVRFDADGQVVSVESGPCWIS
jgi:hypothetical protein